MTIKEAIDEIEKLKKRTTDQYIFNRLVCISEDLSNHMNSPSVGENYELGKGVVEIVEKKRSIDTELERSWVNELYLSFLNMFRFEHCKEYYNDEKNKKFAKKEIDGETWSKGITIITAILTLIIICVAIGLYMYGIGANVDGGFDYDMWAFILTALGALIVIIGWIAGVIWNHLHRNKYANAPYSIEELLAVKYENKPNLLGLISPTAKEISKHKSGNISNSGAGSFNNTGTIKIVQK